MDADDFITLSIRREVMPIVASPPQDVLRRFISGYMETLGEKGCTVIGHIKGMVEDGESPPLFFSVTSLAGETQLKGGPLKSGTRLALSMTVIVAGITADEASVALEDALAKHFRNALET